MPPKRSSINGRVKKLVLADERIGKVNKNTYQLLSKACEIFARELFEGMSQLAVDYEPSPRILKASHLKHVVGSQSHLQFLSPSLEHAPDFQVPEEKIVRKPKPATKKRKKTTAAELPGPKKAKASKKKKEEPIAQQQQQQQQVPLGNMTDGAELSEDDNYDED
jgi:hypothetical protein